MKPFILQELGSNNLNKSVVSIDCAMRFFLTS